MATVAERWARMNSGWATACWESTGKPHRGHVLAALESLWPFASVLEVGCNAGVNLRMIRERWPDVAVSGTDVCPEALAVLGEQLPAARVLPGDLRAVLPILPSREYDVVLSCYCLTYIEPDELPEVMADLRRIVRKGLVLAEPQALGRSTRIDLPFPEWVHDYGAHFGVGWSTRRTMIEPPVDRLNAILTAWRRP